VRLLRLLCAGLVGIAWALAIVGVWLPADVSSRLMATAFLIGLGGVLGGLVVVLNQPPDLRP